MNKPFHAVESARKWRERVSRDVAVMGLREKVAHFQKFESISVLKARKLPTKSLPTVLPTRRKKGFDAVAESRRWKVSARRKGALPKAA